MLLSGFRPSYERVGQPCRNFNILATAAVLDPYDGREKFVLSNFTAGGTGNLIFIDPASGEGESFRLPGDEGAWGLVNWNDEKLVVGTCPQYAYLHVFDLKTRTWAEPLRAPEEKYFWDLTIASDGNVYGGSWPGCSLYRYDPRTHTLERMGRVSDHPNDMYSRPIYGGLPGYVFVAGGYETLFLKAFHIASGTFRDFGKPGYTVREATAEFVCIEKDGDLQFYDSATFEPLADAEGLRKKLSVRAIELPNGQSCRIVRLPSGRLAGVRGQEYFVLDRPDDKPVLRRIPTDAPPTRIHTLAADEAGRIWGSCGFGQTIFRYDPADGSSWNSSSVCNAGGEVYGLQFYGGKLFMSAYVGGDHIVYDPKQPWDQLGNVNPRSLTPVRPDYIRPQGRTVLGPDGGIWTGWSAKYGTYGGALSRIDPHTLTVESWPDPLENGQQVAGLTADGKYVYVTTNGGASGLPYKEDRCWFGVWAPGEGAVYRHSFAADEKTGAAVVAHGGKVWVRAGNRIAVFDPSAMRFTGEIETEEACGWMVAADHRTVAAFCGSRLLLIDTDEERAIARLELPGDVQAAAAAPNGDLYFAVESILYRLPSGYTTVRQD
jgi:hypothetical protein